MKLVEGNLAAISTQITRIRNQRLSQLRGHEQEILTRIDETIQREDIPEGTAISAKELNRSYKDIPKEVMAAVKDLISRLERFYRESGDTGWELSGESGVYFRRRIVPYERVGIFIPRSAEALLSLIHLVVPARIAGVGEIAVASPHISPKHADPLFYYACKTLGIKELYELTGVEAMTYFCFGNSGIRAVDKIFAPGGFDVQCAKRYLNGLVGTDDFLGPAEIAYLIDDKTDSLKLTEAIIEQFLFDPDSLVTLFCLSAEKANETINTFIEISSKSNRFTPHLRTLCGQSTFLFVMRNPSEAVQMINAMSPGICYVQARMEKERLLELTSPSLVVSAPEEVVSQDLAFVGPCFMGPTLGASRFSAILRPSEFYREVDSVDINPEEIDKIRKISKALKDVLLSE